MSISLSTTHLAPILIGAGLLRSTFEWIPYIEAIRARVVAPSGNGAPTPILDAYVHHHPTKDTLQCLALSGPGGVHEGEVSVLQEGAVELALKSYEGEQVVPHVVRLDFEEDGTLRHRIWSGAGDERTLLLDLDLSDSGRSRRPGVAEPGGPSVRALESGPDRGRASLLVRPEDARWRLRGRSTRWYGGCAYRVASDPGPRRTVMTLARKTLLLSALVAVARGAGAQTVTVTTSADEVDVDFFDATIADLPGPDGVVSFREALIATNNVPGHQTIDFQIPEERWYLPDIYPGFVLIQGSLNWSALEPVTIDGTTQTAFTGDTNPDGNEVVLYGLQLTLNGDGSVVTGLDASHVAAFGNGNDIHGNTGDMYIELYNGSGSVIHDNEAETIKLQYSHDNVIVRNTTQRIRVWGAQGPAVNNRIGGPDPADRNYITGWGNYGEHGVPAGTTLELSDTVDTLVENNWIGVTPDGMQIGNEASTAGVGIMTKAQNLIVRDNLIAARSVGVGPSQGALFGQPMYVDLLPGVSSIEVRGNTMGLDASGEPTLGGVNGIWLSNDTISRNADILIQENVIAGHASTGVLMMRSPGVNAKADVRLTANSIWNNGEIDVDLMPDTWTFGPTPNDALDEDEGANGLQNHPELRSATRRGSIVRITGTLESEPLKEFTVEFFASPACNPSGLGPAQVFLGSTTVDTDSLGRAGFDALVPAAQAPVGWVITSTATREPTGETSEVSPCTPVRRLPGWRGARY